jgi:two-component system, sensor histidine kinase and response regulator
MLNRLDTNRAVREGDATDTAAPSAATNGGLPKKVLVVEDNVVSQQVARRYLEAIGCDVVIVENGAEAVAACAGSDFGLVLMDLQMPKMDGLQATQEIRRQERAGRKVPILALTAKSASDELARCTAAGMNGLLTKPLDITRLRHTLDRFGLSSNTLELPAITMPADSSGDPVDLMTLHAKFSGDVAFVRRLCQTFITSTGQCLEELDSALEAAELNRVRQLAHKIKGGSTGVYAHRMAAIADNIESAALTATNAELVTAADALRKAFDEATLHIGARLP